MRLIALFLILTFPNISFAEGPPVERDGKVFVDHVVLHLTDIQLEQVETRRLVEFTSSQSKLLRALNPLVPDSIPVIAPSYNNCTCEFFLYGIWNKPKAIAVPLFLFGVKGWNQQLFDKQFANWASDFFVIDTQANIYWHGKKVSKDDVIKIAKETEGQAFLDLPLMHSPAVASRVNRLVKSLVKEGQKNKIAVNSPDRLR